MNRTAPKGIPATIHPDLFPYGNIADGPVEQVVEAEHWLVTQGCTHVRGPIGFNTWGPYRAVIESDGRPPFLGEPTFAPSVWEANGYKTCAHYASALAQNEAQIASSTERGRSLVEQGWTLQNLDRFGSFDEALRCFHALSLDSFSQAFAYTPIDFESFKTLYKPIESIADPRMVITAFSPDGTPAGFCFSIPDHLNPDLRQFIVKTLAVAPPFRQLGLGSWLTGAAHQIADEQGWTAGGIHALMWTGSHSRQISSHVGQIFRRYALYEKALI